MPLSCQQCAAARLTNQWCDACNVGYVAGVPIKSKFLFETLDAHGHDLVAANFTCPTCKIAIATEGFCEPCRIGWIDKKAYFSRLTYHLAKGVAKDPSTLSCTVCRKNSETYGWCERCGHGMVGNVEVKSRADFEGGRRGYELMMTAIEASGRCEMCGQVIITDGSCFVCKISYKDGKAVTPTTAPSVANPGVRGGP
ncbi:MAG TPA: hypothetical protein VNT79_11120 [Phycisphaerae bacterium]|nr:hypothetical protein [Phycisphaerae bacterium]